MQGEDADFRVEGSRILFERAAAYRNLPGQEWGPPVWDFAAKGA